jgi:outer membrane protein TolC
LLLSLAAGCGAASAEGLSIDEARRQLEEGSDSLRAARLNQEARGLEAEAARSLDLPTVSATVMYSKLERKFELNTSPLSAVVPGFPNQLDLTYKNEGVRPIVSVNWPLFTGGKITAAQQLATARTAEAGATLKGTSESLATRLVSTYYGLQLAEQALVVRQSVFDALTLHLHQAQRFETTGLIARADRIHAQVAYDEARRELLKAQDDRALAQSALNHLLNSKTDVQPASPLFVRSTPIEPLNNWLDLGMSGHPVLAVLDAKRQQTLQLQTIEKSRLMPDVLATGFYELNHDVLTPVEPDWLVGVVVHMTLFDSQDRMSRIEASKRETRSVEALTAQAKSDLSTLIEKRWRELDQARNRYLLLESSISLAEENVRLREAGFREGQATSLDLVDARLSLAKAQIERAQAARDYDVSLAELLEASGQSDRFTDYANRADIRIETPNANSGAKP